MKNFKMILSAFAVVAIVSGALAFKSKAFSGGSIYCLASGTTQAVCPVADVVEYVPGGLASDPCPVIAPGTVAHVTSGSTCINSTASGFTSVN